ncbi:hypothetical protein E2C01_080774 [Portunus trituberculatus]|uniref:Uncharacterized protein n=1 Tax=Portunus trituberculatus TaxID=210409 RepID=A0A5B7IWZ4_PORTR|nr:hypothetical protein [Portunus trituberculatus]
MWEELLSFRPLVVQAILFIVVPILGPISAAKRIFDVTTQNLGIMVTNGIASKRHVVGFELTRGRLPNPTLTTLSTICHKETVTYVLLKCLQYAETQ